MSYTTSRVTIELGRGEFGAVANKRGNMFFYHRRTVLEVLVHIDFQSIEKKFRARIQPENMVLTHTLEVVVAGAHRRLDVKTTVLQGIFAADGGTETAGYEFEYFQISAPAPHKISGLLPPFQYKPTTNTFSAIICHTTKTVRFGPVNAIKASPGKIGIGSALMGAVIERLQGQPLTSSYRVAPGSLAEAHAIEDEARKNRNKFYMAHGFQLSSKCGLLHGLDVVEGFFAAESVGSLTTAYKRGVRAAPITSVADPGPSSVSLFGWLRVRIQLLKWWRN
ncbi:hypothetical protein ACF8Q9_03410 [Pseudomonas sp. TYF_15]|uniref:hypothetical protein n=1 Tax=Pseudomonas sp. TYF_15 TaxID=3367194 RepID=UPI00370A0B77